MIFATPPSHSVQASNHQKFCFLTIPKSKFLFTEESFLYPSFMMSWLKRFGPFEACNTKVNYDRTSLDFIMLYILFSLLEKISSDFTQSIIIVVPEQNMVAIIATIIIPFHT